MSLLQLKKKNRLISTGICILLFDVFNRCSLIQLRKKIKKLSNVKRQTFTTEKN